MNSPLQSHRNPGRIMSFFNHLLDLSLDAAPYLLLGLLLAGLIKAWLPESWVKKQLSGKGRLPVVKAALLGAPMPLCSCSVIPVALGIRRGGASKGATTSFLISTPETGVDSISLTYAMMGPVMAIVRPVAAVLTALTAGLWVNSSGTKSCCSSGKEPHEESHQKQEKSSCCSSKQQESVKKSCCGSKEAKEEKTTSSCCSKSEPSAVSAQPLEEQKAKSCCSSKLKADSSKLRALDGVEYAFGRLYEDILLWLAAGLLIATAVQTYVPADWLAQWGSGWLAKGIMLLVGIPMYICASASTPMAAGLMLAGVSPGTVLVFLLAGPATNFSTMAILRNELGTSVMVKYITTVMVGALLAGVLFDAALMDTNLDLVAQHHQHAEMLPLWLSGSCLAILLLAAIKPVRQLLFSGLRAL